MTSARPLSALLIALACLPGCAVTAPHAPRAEGAAAPGVLSQAEQAFQAGRQHQQAKQLDLAERDYRTAIALKPDYIEAQTELAALVGQRGRLAEADEMLTALSARPHPSAVLLNNLGYVRYLRGDYAQALVALRAALALEPTSERTRNNLLLAEQAQARLNAPRDDAASATGAVTVAGTAGSSQVAAPQTAAAAGRPAVQAVGGDVLAADPASSTPAAAAADAQVAHGANPGAADADILSAIGPSTRVLNPLRQAVVSDTLNNPPALQDAAASATVRSGQLPPARAVHPSRAPRTPSPSTAIAPAASSAGGAALGSAAAQRNFRLEVVNAAGVQGIARRVQTYLSGKGAPAARLSNQRPYTEQASRIEYRPGYQGEAARLGATLPNHPVLVPSTAATGSDVRVVLGRDLALHSLGKG